MRNEDMHVRQLEPQEQVGVFLQLAFQGKARIDQQALGLSWLKHDGLESAQEEGPIIQEKHVSNM